jgi:poly(A) polymerase
VSEARRRLDAAWLRESPLSEILSVLDSAGEEARVVGGAVRNTLIGDPPGDIDIATTALPPEVVKRVEAAGFRAVPTGIEHGTITVVANGRPFEVTTLREDIETFGRRAKVAFGRNWQRDAERRDFTMNALSTSREGRLYDYVGGLADIAGRRVRFIGNASSRIAEDYLRILRFFRFHAAYGEGAPDPEGLAASIAGRAGLEQLSRERVRMELFKLLVARHAVGALAVMTETGLLEQVLGGVPLLASFANVTGLEAAVGLPSDAIRRLVALAVSVSEDADRMRNRLRVANLEYERMASMADGWWHISSTWDEQRARVLLYRIGREHFLDRVLLAWARSPAFGAGLGAGDESWHALAKLPARWTAPVFPLRAADFIKRGLPKGPRLGAALAAAEEAWAAAGFPLDPAALSAIAEAASAAPRQTSDQTTR